MMSERDFEATNDNFWHFQRLRMKHEGVDDEMLESIFDKNPAVRFRSAPYTPELLHEGDILEYGGHRLEGFYTPGHTPGHMCFYDRENEIMFLGDHVLFDITPNITSRHTVHNALGCYLDSLKRIRAYSIKLALPAHRTMGDKTVAERVDELLLHHQERLDEALRIVRENPGIDAYKAAGMMTWRIRARNWADFPPAQKSFAIGETFAHMDYLLDAGLIKTEEKDGLLVYSAV